jgi:hypothetical protein
MSADGPSRPYDLQQLQVFDAGDAIIFRARTRDLTLSPAGPGLPVKA